jgi:AbiV family abortive infection protein
MERHATCAKSLLDAGQAEGAFLFFLLGLEELGKLIQLVDAGQAAEASGSEVAEVPDFLDHDYKAEQGTKNLARAFDLFIPPMQEAGMDTSLMQDQVRHLTIVKDHFKMLREGMMYVDYINDAWFLGHAPPPEDIGKDIALLQLARVVLKTNLNRAPDRGFRSFAGEMNKSVSEFKVSLPQIIKGIQAAAKLLGEDEGPE